MTDRLPQPTLILLVALAISFAGCAQEQGSSNRPHEKESASETSTADSTSANRSASKSGASGEETREETVEKKYTPPKELLPPPEPADSPPPDEEPAGEEIELGSGPEGVVADPETGLVAVGLRNPDQLALVDGESGEVVRRVGLSGQPRHLGLAAPGGPVLVPAEPSDSLIQVGLPEGKILYETPVGNFPHNAAAAPGGRVFAISEAASTAAVIENGRVIQTIKTPLNPGGVAVTQSGVL
ncbi:MAG: YncE family protein, partial [Rubrobacter sp.]